MILASQNVQIAEEKDFVREKISGIFFVNTSQQKQNICLPTNVLFLFIQAAGLVWNQRAPRVVWTPDEVAHGIARSAYRIKFLRLDAIHDVAVIPSSPLG